MRKLSSYIISKSLLSITLIICICGCDTDEPIVNPDSTGQKGQLTDIQGNVYKTIGIGSQIWLAENLRSTKLNDNTEIKFFKDSIDWSSTSENGYSWYNNDTVMKIPYGGLYSWNTVNSGKLCPIGWHIPSEDEWYTLVNKLGGKDVAGGKLKVIGIDFWLDRNNGATNSSKFNAVPSGDVFYGHFWSLGKSSCWWSSTESDTIFVITTSLSNKSPGVLIGPGGRRSSCGLSVRCIKNQ